MKNQFIENDTVIITKYDILIKNKNRFGGKIGYYVVDESVDIDTPDDLLRAEQMFMEKRNERNN